MHFGFRPLFRRTFAKIPLSANPSHQQGAHQRKSKHQGPWCLALAKPHFWKLGCCIWSLLLETSESNVRSTSGRCKDVLQDHGIWLAWFIISKFFRELEKKTFARVSNITRTAFAIKIPYKISQGPLDRLPYQNHLFVTVVSTHLTGQASTDYCNVTQTAIQIQMKDCGCWYQLTLAVISVYPLSLHSLVVRLGRASP